MQSHTSCHRVMKRAAVPLSCMISVCSLLVRSSLSFRPNSIRSTRSSLTMATVAVAEQYGIVKDRVRELNPDVRLVAVSKTKPKELLQVVYDAGCRCFGENYAQELMEKAVAMPNDISWHFIGNLQSNKVKKLVENVEILTVETVDTTKLANRLNQVATEHNKDVTVFVQVNTSLEDSKGGISSLDEVKEVCRHILDSCDKLKLQGLMTIGAVGDLSCFTKLKEYRDTVNEELGVSLELSMGMSNDYEEAIAAGSTNVRVGSTIFGARDYSNKK